MIQKIAVSEPPDFIFQDPILPTTFIQKMRVALRILFLPIWGPYTTCKYGLQRLAMIPVYPAQSRLLQQQIDHINPMSLQRFRSELLSSMQKEGFFIREVTIERNKVQYHGFMISRPETQDNGKWVLQAAGNTEAIEYYSPIAKEYAKAGFNTLLINGPSVGKSKGRATPRSMGEAQESGLQILETHIKAKKIAITGFSLGSAAIGQAILRHEFKKDIQYLVIRQLAFDRLSNIARKILAFPILSRIAPKLVHWTELEMDNVLVSKKLQSLHIPEIIIQASNKFVDPSTIPDTQDFAHDGVVPKTASLGYRLVKEGVIENKIFLCIPFARHLSTWPAYELTRDLLKDHL